MLKEWPLVSENCKRWAHLLLLPRQPSVGIKALGALQCSPTVNLWLCVCESVVMCVDVSVHVYAYVCVSVCVHVFSCVCVIHIPVPI